MRLLGRMKAVYRSSCRFRTTIGLSTLSTDQSPVVTSLSQRGQDRRESARSSFSQGRRSRRAAAISEKSTNVTAILPSRMPASSRQSFVNHVFVRRCTSRMFLANAAPASRCNALIPIGRSKLFRHFTSTVAVPLLRVQYIAEYALTLFRNYMAEVSCSAPRHHHL